MEKPHPVPILVALLMLLGYILGFWNRNVATVLFGSVLIIAIVAANWGSVCRWWDDCKRDFSAFVHRHP